MPTKGNQVTNLQRVLSIGVALAASYTQQAVAQVAGTYAGADSAGEPVRFTVASAGSTSGLQITDTLIYYVDKCHNSSVVLKQGDEFVSNAVISGNTVTYTSNNRYGFYSYTLVFSSDSQAATGKVTVTHAIADTTHTPPAAARLCVEKNAPLKLTLQPSS